MALPLELAQIPEKNLNSTEEIKSLNMNCASSPYRHKKRIQSFFSADNDENKNFLEDLSKNFNDLPNISTNFSFARFLEFSFYHFLFFCILGPFCNFFFYITKGNLILARNLGFWGHTYYFYMQSFVFFLNFLGIFGYIYLLPWKMNFIEMIGLIGSSLVRTFVIAVKYAYYTEKQMLYVKNKILSDKEKNSELMINWAKQSDEYIEKEIEETLIRNHIDNNLFKFQFFKPLKESILMAFIEKHKEESEKKIYSGGEIAKFLLRSVRNDKLKKTPMMICFLLSLIRALIPIIYRYITSYSVMQNSISNNLIMICLLLINLYFFSVNYLFIYNGINEYNRRGVLLAKLSSLISIETLEKYKIRKDFPTINFFCKMSFNSWYSLNKLFRDYGQRFYNRIDMHLGIFLVYYSIIALIGLLVIYKVIQFSNTLLIILFGYEAFVIFIGLLILIWKGVVINEHFTIQRELINNCKHIINKFYLHEDAYLYDPSYQPENEIYKFSKEVLLKHFDDTDIVNQPNIRLARDNYLIKLLKICKNIQKELEFDQNERPFKVLGVTADKAFFQKIIAGLTSLATASIEQICSLTMG